MTRARDSTDSSAPVFLLKVATAVETIARLKGLFGLLAVSFILVPEQFTRNTCGSAIVMTWWSRHHQFACNTIETLQHGPSVPVPIALAL